MKYPLPTEPIQQAARKQINEKLLYLIDNDACAAYDISKADVFQAYTGRGGLHGLRRSDYNSYAAYSETKKEAENGQIFTPAYLCQFVVDCLQIGVDDLVADLTCGMGTFFNFLPNEHNAYGCELDIDAYKVAAFLYPQAHLENKDIRRYAPGVQFDYILGNPPYNLRWWVKEGKTYLSQLYYCIKAAELLKPLGILAVIVPTSFLGDTFTDGTMIACSAFLDRFRCLRTYFVIWALRTFRSNCNSGKNGAGLRWRHAIIKRKVWTYPMAFPRNMQRESTAK